MNRFTNPNPLLSHWNTCQHEWRRRIVVTGFLQDFCLFLCSSIYYRREVAFASTFYSEGVHYEFRVFSVTSCSRKRLLSLQLPSTSVCFNPKYPVQLLQLQTARAIICMTIYIACIMILLRWNFRLSDSVTCIQHINGANFGRGIGYPRAPSSITWRKNSPYYTNKRRSRYRVVK
jgi:hypothetical protein